MEKEYKIVYVEHPDEAWGIIGKGITDYNNQIERIAGLTNVNYRVTVNGEQYFHFFLRQNLYYRKVIQ